MLIDQYVLGTTRKWLRVDTDRLMLDSNHPDHLKPRGVCHNVKNIKNLSQLSFVGVSPSNLVTSVHYLRLKTPILLLSSQDNAQKATIWV